VTVGTEEKGWASIDIVIHGTSGHGSTPWGSDNAIQKAAMIVNRLPQLRLSTSTSLAWKAWKLSNAFPSLNRHPTQLGSQFIGDQTEFPSWLAALANAANSTTVSANQIEGGLRRNMIPDRVILRLDVRLVADDTGMRVKDEICALLGDYLHDVEVNINGSWDATSSEIDSFAWPVMRQVVLDLVGRELLPTPVTAATDARFFRKNGIPAYGLGLMSQEMDYASYWSRFHGINERIDVKSIDLSISLWEQLLKTLLSDPPKSVE
jgi:acetylornithine deacetylase/succinyl-diaminopimelate desuccinylase-like protein